MQKTDSGRSGLPLLLILGAALVLGGCAKKQDETTSALPGETTSAVPEETTSAAPPVGTPTTSAPLTDARIAAIVIAANDADIANGQLAQGKASRARVVAFAKRMIADHTSANYQATTLAGRIHLTPEASDRSRQMTEHSAEMRETLATVDRAAFDKAYIDGEVAMHEQVLSALDDQLIPAAQNADLRQLLTSVRSTIALHLAEAQQIQGELGGS